MFLSLHTPCSVHCIPPSFKPPGRVASFIYAPLNRINQTEADSAAAPRPQVPKIRKWRQRWFFEQIIVWKAAYYTSNREVFGVYFTVLIRFSPETGNKLKFQAKNYVWRGDFWKIFENFSIFCAFYVKFCVFSADFGKYFDYFTRFGLQQKNFYDII